MLALDVPKGLDSKEGSINGTQRPVAEDGFPCYEQAPSSVACIRTGLRHEKHRDQTESIRAVGLGIRFKPLG